MFSHIFDENGLYATLSHFSLIFLFHWTRELKWSSSGLFHSKIELGCCLKEIEKGLKILEEEQNI